ncbi:MAG: bifunctional oligoribonuclease/PAP phosphatase NrnA [Chloroflexi bacterium]|nr:bifunctional oligoribonuclease/PAP phosphatase NrnA [Chloroflexota bacterium]
MTTIEPTMDWDKASALVREAQTVLIVTHVSPDGDAIGAMLGLAHALRSQGKDVITAVDAGVPSKLAFLPGAETVLPALNGVTCDLVVAVDCGDEARMGAVGQVARRSAVPLINLDHHRTNTYFGDANLVDLDTVAAAEGVLDWLDRLGVPVDPAAAHCLLTGIVTDTLCFRTDRVTATTLAKAQRLMDAGVSLSDIVQNTVSRKPYAALRLWSAAMPAVHLEDHVIWAVITHEMFQQAQYPGNDDAGLVGMLVQTDEAYIAAVFRQREDGGIELGFRAVPGYDTSQVAVDLGGGGHPLASGATVFGEPPEMLVPRVIDRLKAIVRSVSTPVT